MAKPGSRSKPRRGELTRDQVVAAALACLDRHGIEHFSLREVARDLGVYPTAVYWHVPGGRNAHLAEVAARVLAGVTPPLDAAVAWQSWLLALFRRYRAAVRAHPNAAPLLGAQLVSNSGVQAEIVDGVVWSLERAGFAGERLLDAYNVAVAGMVGFATLEFARPPQDDTSQWEATQQERVATLADGRYPSIARHAQTLAGRAFILRWKDGVASPMERSFEAFAGAMIVGLARLAESA